MTSLLLQVRFGDPLYNLYIQFIFLPLFIQIAVVLTVIAVLSTIIAYAVLLYRRYTGHRDEGRRRRMQPIVDDLIINQVVLNPGLAEGVPLNQIEFDEAALRNPRFRIGWVRQFMIDRIIHYRRNMAGDTGILLARLFEALGLERISLKKLNSTSWHKQTEGIVELTAVGVPIPDVTILPLTNSKQQELRSVARNAYVQLSKNEPFKFFDIATEPLLPWDQLELFRTITTTKGIVIPNFSRWISYSVNPSIVAFSMKLIVYYNQVSAIPALINLLNTPDHLIRADAINTLGKLTAEEAEDRLVLMYPSQPTICQIEILKALGRFASGKHLEFLKTEFITTQDYDIRKHAAKSITRHRGRAKAVLSELDRLTTEDQKLMLRHVANPLIKN